MKRILTTAAALAAAASGAHAGGVERSSQSVAILFEDGRYAELSFGSFSPDVSGTAFGAASGDMAPSFTSYSLGYKMDVGDRMDFALVIDQPIGADVDYPAGTLYPLAGSTAKLTSTAITALLRYQFGGNISAFGGLRYETVQGVVALPAYAYALSTNNDRELGYVVGAAWEKPEIAARVALTYNSAITHSLEAVETTALGSAETTFDTEVPQSVNLEFQTGIAKDTLLFGSIRWVEWTAFEILPPIYEGFGLGPLAAHAKDRVTYNLGIGRRFNDTWSGALLLGYEPRDGEQSGNLGPTDGYKSIGLAATYSLDNMKITGGVRYVDIGDTTTTILNGSFTGNSGVGLGVKVGYSF